MNYNMCPFALRKDTYCVTEGYLLLCNTSSSAMQRFSCLVLKDISFTSLSTCGSKAADMSAGDFYAVNFCKTLFFN